MIFPEGTRIRRGSLGRPRRGVGRLALESGAPVVPIAVSGSEHARRGWRIRPVKVHLRFGAPLTFPRVESPSPFLAGEVTERIWPCVELQWEWLGGLPPLRTAAVVGAGSMGTAAAVVLARAGLEVQLGCRTSEQADAAARRGRERRLPAGRAASTARSSRARCATWSSPGWTSWCWPCPAARCPPPSARSAPGWASAAPCSWPRRASCRRSAPRRRPSWPSASGRAPWRRWPVPPTRARRSSWARRWCSPPATPTCSASWARCSRPAA